VLSRLCRFASCGRFTIGFPIALLDTKKEKILPYGYTGIGGALTGHIFRIFVSDIQETTEQAFTRWYDAYGDAIFRYVYYRVRSRDEALDVVQVVFMRLWDYLQEGREITHPKAFLYRSARNTLINAVRDRKQHLSLEELMDQGFEAAYTEADKDELERQEEVIARIHDLDEQYREVLVLRYVNGLGVKEIAELLGEAENTVSVRIHRGLRKLKMLYGKN